MNRLRLLVVSASVFFLVLAIGGTVLYLADQRHNDRQRQALRDLGTTQAHLLEDHLDRSLSSTFALASILRQRGSIDHFDALAAEMIESYGGISSLQLAPGGVVTEIYPLAGNEAARGHDLLKDPERRTEALAAIESRRLTLAGPLSLIQGGVAVIGRLPVFIPDETGGERFWGFTIASVHFRNLLDVSQINRLVEHGYDYEISRIDPDTGAPVVFARSAGAALHDGLRFDVRVPNGKWTMTVAPRGGWPSSPLLPVGIALAVVAAMLIAGLTYVLLRQPEVLRRKVESRTRELGEANRALEVEIGERARAENHFRQLLESAPDAIVIARPDGTIALANEEAQRLFDYSREEIIGRSIEALIPERLRQGHNERRADYLGRPRTRPMGNGVELYARRRDGSEVPVEVTLSPLETEGGLLVSSSIRDITERKREARQLQRKMEEVSALHDLNLAMSSTLDLPSRLKVLMEKTAWIMPHVAIQIDLYDKDRRELRTMASLHLGPNGPAEGPSRNGWQACSGVPFETKSPLLIRDLRTDPRVTDPEFARRHGLKSYLGVPLIVDQEALGVLGFYTRGEHDFSDEEKSFLSTLSGQAAMAIHNSRLYQEVAGKTIELEKANRQLSSLYAVSNTVNESLDTESMLKGVMRRVLEVLEFDAARVYLVDRQSDELRLRGHQGFPGDAYFLNRPRLGLSVTGHVFASGEALFIEDMESDPTYRAITGRSAALKAGFRSTFRIPIKIKEKTMGVLGVFGRSVRRFSVGEKDLICAIANHLAIAVDNANLLEETMARVSELSALYSVSRTISNSLDIEIALRGGMQKVQEIFGFDLARLYLFDKKEDELHLLAYEGDPGAATPLSSIKAGQGISGKALVEGRIFFFEDLQTDPDYLTLKHHGYALKAGYRGSLTIPIKAKSRVAGVMIFNSKAPHRFLKSEIQLTEAIANNLGVVLENLNLFREVKMKSEELQESHRELQGLTGRLLSAQEDERRRLARELHDDLTQKLAVLAIEIGKLERQPASWNAARVALQQIKDQIVQVSTDVHDISRQLHPSILEDLGLTKAVESECINFFRREGIRIAFSARNVPCALPKEVALCLYRISQEGLRNMAKHARTKNGRISLDGDGDGLTLTIHDAGVGFVAERPGSRPGVGLASMNERARLIGAALSLRSEPGKGTTIEVRVSLTGGSQ